LYIYIFCCLYWILEFNGYFKAFHSTFCILPKLLL
jgi:hypothetical protein